MKRHAMPKLSSSGELVLAEYGQTLLKHEDLAPTIIRNYLSNIRHFMVWYESHLDNEVQIFTPQTVTTPDLTRYSAYLQTDQRQRTSSVNRSLIRLKRYFGWALKCRIIYYDPSAPVKLVEQEDIAPRHLDNQEVQAMVATVTKQGTLRDHVLIVLLLHIGLRAREICRLRRDQLKLGKRSGTLEVIGKRNKYREVPLNITARKALEEYLPTLPAGTSFLVPSTNKREKALSERALGYIVKKYASSAKLPDVSLHDLRHRFGYRMAESVPLHRLAQIMGHVSLDTTKIYI